MVDISVITFTIGGRDKYLEQAICSVVEDLLNAYENIKVEYHIVFQGCKRPQYVYDVIANEIQYRQVLKLYCHDWPENIGIAAGLNKIIPECKGNLIFKMDDDCKIVSNHLFENARLIHKAFPTAIFSPFPISLVNNPAGPPGYKRALYYDKKSDSYFQLRLVNHVGGFARFWPKNDFVFQPDLIPGMSGNEDGQLSQWANSEGIPMFYVESNMVVEHNEGLGQQIRYPEYFKNRVGDLDTFKRWIN